MPQVSPMNWLFILVFVFFSLLVSVAKLGVSSIRAQFGGVSVIGVKWYSGVSFWGV